MRSTFPAPGSAPGLAGAGGPGLGAVNLALVSLYFIPVWGRDAVRALISPYHGLEEPPHAALVFCVRELFDLGFGAMVSVSHALAGIRLVIAAALVAYAIEFARALAIRRETDQITTDVALILSSLAVAASLAAAFAAGDAGLLRLAATQTLLVAGAVGVIALERHIAVPASGPVATGASSPRAAGRAAALLPEVATPRRA